ncbi:MAG: DUF1697 domain-containing protein, partial [Candidatus Zixiibacteriota bacterium]
TDARCTEVQTYIQSGNVVFNATAAVTRTLSTEVQAQIRRRFKLEVPVIIRTAAQLKAVWANNPFLKRGGDESRLHVMFLADKPSPKMVAELDPARSTPDEFIVKGAEIYLHLPNGTARSKLTNQYFDSRLRTVSTLRNWRTVLKLLELTQSA